MAESASSADLLAQRYLAVSLERDELERECAAWRDKAIELSERVALLEDQNDRLSRALSHS